MKHARSRSVAILSLLGVALSAGAFASVSKSDSPHSTPASTAEQARPVLAELAWIAGTWREEQANGDLIEERWDPPLGNAMTGTMRWMHDGKAKLYEFLLLEEDADGVHLYVSHFNPGCKAWEGEKEAALTFELEEVADGVAVFGSKVEFPRRYTMRKGADGVLHAALEGVRGGKPMKLEFAYKPLSP
jgi:hypothetical protein